MNGKTALREMNETKRKTMMGTVYKFIMEQSIDSNIASNMVLNATLQNSVGYQNPSYRHIIQSTANKTGVAPLDLSPIYNRTDAHIATCSYQTYENHNDMEGRKIIQGGECIISSPGVNLMEYIHNDVLSNELIIKQEDCF